MSVELIDRNPPLLSDNPQDGQAEELSCIQKIQDVYDRIIGSFLDWLKDCGCFPLSGVLGALLLEPISCLRTAVNYLLYGCCTQVRFSNVNPEELTAEQLELNPVLCIHGNFLAQTSFTSIAETLGSNPDYNPAVFTVQVNCGWITNEDYELINAKIDQIKALYARNERINIKIDVIGHSRGAYLADQMCSRRPEDIDRVILLGHDTSSVPGEEKVFLINGTREHLIHPHAIQSAARKALHDPEHAFMLRTGHFGLLYDAGDTIVEILKT